MTAPTPEQMRALADRSRESLEFVGSGDWTPQDTLLAHAVAALRAAADQLEAVRGLLPTIDPGSPYTYDPWTDESVDPTNTDEVVRASVSAGWSKGAYELATRIREVMEGVTSDD